MIPLTLYVILSLGYIRFAVSGFISPLTSSSYTLGRRSPIFTFMDKKRMIDTGVSLFMVSDGSIKKRRKRKQQPTKDIGIVSSDDKEANVSVPQDNEEEDEENEDISEPSNSKKEAILSELKAVAQFNPKSGAKTSLGERRQDVSTSPSQGIVDSNSMLKSDAPLVELPDIRDTFQRKEMKKIEQEQEKKTTRPKISRKDKEAFIRLLEEEPFADADDSYFEEEKYGVINALLAERAQPFLGIPPGPLQVGHFIGALVIVLMAFIEYPGFPLTNLPTPIRDCLQAALLGTYVINTVLAFFATSKAAERGQPKLLWAVKTFSVGGLAFDQLTQLPTLEQIKEEEKKLANMKKSKPRRSGV